MEGQNYSMLNHFDNLVNMIILADRVRMKKAEAEKLTKELKILEDEVSELVRYKKIKDN